MSDSKEKALFNSASDLVDPGQQALYLEQYKQYVQGAEKISERRQTTNSYFLGINTAFISLLGLSSQIPSLAASDWWKIIGSLLGTLICVTWWYSIKAYKQLNSGKFEVIHKIEERLPLNLYDYEWTLLGRGNDKKRYYPSSHIDLLVPVLIGIFYLAMLSNFVNVDINISFK